MRVFRLLPILILAVFNSSPVSAANEIIVQSTTSTKNSGLYDHILPLMTRDTGVTARIVAVGTGAAIKNAMSCDGDVLLVHAKSAEENGFKVIIAGAGGAAHLPGMVASLTALPVLGVPISSKALSGIDSLYSIVQMPKGVPVGTLAIGAPGAINAALLAARMLATNDKELSIRLKKWISDKTESVTEEPV